MLQALALYSVIQQAQTAFYLHVYSLKHKTMSQAWVLIHNLHFGVCPRRHQHTKRAPMQLQSAVGLDPSS